MDVKEGFKSWAIVQVMGHTVYAGFATDASIGGQSYLRVDVPEIKDEKPFTKYLGPGSIFSITPCDEDTARAAASSRQIRPFDVYSLNDIARELAKKHAGKCLPDRSNDEPDGEDYDDYDDEVPL